jgi:CRISPR system Cascade subunit CasE
MTQITLARLTLDPRHWQGVKLLGDPYALHKFMFETVNGDRDPGRVLYRLELPSATSGAAPYVLIQLEHPVSLRVNGAASFASVQAKSVRIDLSRDATYRFRARVNPVRSLPPESRTARGKRVGVYEPDAQQEWFRQRLERSGMEACSLIHTREPWLRFRRGASGSGRLLTFASALFEGDLTVRDTRRAESTLVGGIGPGKGFGFGLLSLAVVRA